MAGSSRAGVEVWPACGALEPVEEFFVEALVERFGVQRIQPGFEQPVEVLGLVASIHPLEPLVQGQLAQDIQMRAVRVSRVNLAYEGHIAKHIAVGVARVDAAIDEG